MAYDDHNLITDASTQPVPQYLNATETGYEPVKGANGATRTMIYDASGNPLFTSGNPAIVQLTGSKVTEVVVSSAVQIRTITSGAYQPGGSFGGAIVDPKSDVSAFKSKTIFIWNTHDQTVTVEVYCMTKSGSSASYTIKLGETAVTAGSRVRLDSSQAGFALLDKPFTRLFYNAKTTVAPNTGDLTIILEGVY